MIKQRWTGLLSFDRVFYGDGSRYALEVFHFGRFLIAVSIRALFGVDRLVKRVLQHSPWDTSLRVIQVGYRAWSSLLLIALPAGSAVKMSSWLPC